MPARKKPSTRAVDNRHGGRGALTLAGTSLSKFDPPAGLCAHARDAWDAYWADPVSSAPTVADRTLLIRWVDNLSRYSVSMENADIEPLVEGSTGQLVVNPLYKIAEMALKTVKDCEIQLGVGAKHRADLGLTMASVQRSMADMNRDLREQLDDDSEEQDPRLVVIEGEVTASRRVS